MSILQAWQNRDFSTFLKLLENKADLNALHPATGYSTILENIAQTVSPESKMFAEALIHAGANVDQFNATTGKTALHIAAEKLNYPVMEALINANVDINLPDLKDSNTVLHILAKKVSPHLDPLHEKCLDLVLSRPDLYLNHANHKSMTPVLTAYEQGAWRVMHKLLKAGAVVEDLDYVAVGKKSLREEIRERCPEILSELPGDQFQYSGPKPELKALKKFLNSGTEDQFCYEFNIYMADTRLRDSRESERDCWKLLNIAVKRQLLKASQVLLNFLKLNLPADEMSSNLSNILIQACKTGNPKLVQLILEENPTEIEKCLHVLTEEQPFTEPHEQCLKLIARKCNPTQINKINEHGETPLHRAAKHDNAPAITILLDKGANIFEMDDYGQHAYELIPNEILENFLNTKIEKDSDGGAYYFDLEFLSPNSKTSEDEKKFYTKEMEPIRKLATSNKGGFITHPVFKAFISEKWQSFLPLFYVSVLLTAVYDVTLIFYISESLRKPYFEHFATRVVLLIFLIASTIFSIVHLPNWQALERGNRWLGCVLKILSLTILARSFHSYPDWCSLVFVATGITAAVHLFTEIGRHKYFGIAYVLSVFCVVETAIPSLPNYINYLSICRYLLLAIFFTHLIGLSFDSAREILSNRDYYQLRMQIMTLADFEETFLTRSNFLLKYFQMPEFRGVNTLLFFAQRNERMRLNTNRGNVLEGFGRKKKPSWWARAVTLDPRTVNKVREISRKLKAERREVVHESEIDVLVAKTDVLIERIRNFSVVLEKLENKGRDMENLLIQIMRVNSLRDEQA